MYKQNCALYVFLYGFWDGKIMMGIDAISFSDFTAIAVANS